MATPKVVTAADVKSLVSDGKPVNIIDVRLEDDFNAAHIDGAKNFCVFESASVGKLIDAFGNAKDQSFVVYGENASCHGSSHAQYKMRRLGFTNVADLREGLAGWKAAGLTVTSGPAVQPPAPVADGTRTIDLKETRVEWTGRNLLNKHTGSLGVKSGTLTFAGGRLTGGEFVIDMNDIKCYDLQGDYHDYLIGHLKNEDFFDVENFPEASFKMEKTSVIDGALPGAPNLQVTGTLVIKNRPQQLEFTAASGRSADRKFAAQATFAFDRTKHNVLYGSGKMFARLAGHVVNDMIEMQIRLVEA